MSVARKKRESTLAEQVAAAQKVVASWTPEKRATVQLEGFDPYAKPPPRRAAKPPSGVDGGHATGVQATGMPMPTKP